MAGDRNCGGRGGKGFSVGLKNTMARKKIEAMFQEPPTMKGYDE